jgi:hypothetical protein
MLIPKEAVLKKNRACLSGTIAADGTGNGRPCLEGCTLLLTPSTGPTVVLCAFTELHLVLFKGGGRFVNCIQIPNDRY